MSQVQGAPRRISGARSRTESTDAPKMSEVQEAPRMIGARRTESVDAPNIMCLVTPSTDALFGRTNVVNLM